MVKTAQKGIPKRTEESGGVSSKQAMVYMAIVVACFVVVYPRMIHPMLKLALGFGGNQDAEKKAAQQADYPPQMLNRGKPMPGGPMRPPPGARGDAGVDTGKGGGGGMMTMILPIYAGGLLLYLLYAASKAYKGGPSAQPRRDPHEETYALITERLAGLDLEKVISGEDTKGASEINKLAEFLRRRNEGMSIDPSAIDELEDEDLGDSVEVIASALPDHPSEPSGNSSTKDALPVVNEDDTEQLLRKCESNEDMSPAEMLRLKTHLAQMEGRMNKLMSALQSVQTKTAEVAEQVIQTTELSNQHPAGNKLPEGVDELPEGVDELPEGVDELPEGVDELPEGVDELPEGVDELPEGVDELPEGVDELPEGVDELPEGVDESSEGVDELSGLASEDEDRLSAQDLSDIADDISSLGAPESEDSQDRERLEVEELYEELSSSEDDTVPNHEDMESGGVRRRHVDMEDLSDDNDEL